MAELTDPNWEWRKGAHALAVLENASCAYALTTEMLDREAGELRRAIREARNAGVPEDGIAQVTGLDEREIDAIAGTVDQHDPRSELANAKIHALASIEHLRRNLAYNYPANVIRQQRKMTSEAITKYCTVQDALARKMRDG